MRYRDEIAIPCLTVVDIYFKSTTRVIEKNRNSWQVKRIDPVRECINKKIYE